MVHYKRLGVEGLQDCDATVKFIRRMNTLIDAMNSNTRTEGLKLAENIAEQDPCSSCGELHDENTPHQKKPARKVH